jgi:hypothetical protein
LVTRGSSLLVLSDALTGFASHFRHRLKLPFQSLQCPGLYRKRIEFGDESDLGSRDAALDELALDLTMDDLPVQPCAETIA